MPKSIYRLKDLRRLSRVAVKDSPQVFLYECQFWVFADDNMNFCALAFDKNGHESHYILLRKKEQRGMKCVGRKIRTY
jgi:hypothetical protein